MIELGDRVTDILTGFSGVAVSRITKLFGDPEIQILPERLNYDGSPAASVWFEESRIVSKGSRIETHETLSREG